MLTLWVKSGQKNRRYRLIFIGCHVAGVFETNLHLVI